MRVLQSSLSRWSLGATSLNRDAEIETLTKALQIVSAVMTTTKPKTMQRPVGQRWQFSGYVP